MAMVGGPIREINTCARTLAENVGGLIREGGRICGTLYGIIVMANQITKNRVGLEMRLVMTAC